MKEKQHPFREFTNKGQELLGRLRLSAHRVEEYDSQISSMTPEEANAANEAWKIAEANALAATDYHWWRAMIKKGMSHKEMIELWDIKDNFASNEREKDRKEEDGNI